MKYSEILKLNSELKKKLEGDSYQITILSNVMTFQLNEILEYYLRVEGVNAKVNSGDYNTILQDSLRYNNSDLVIVFWELSNLTDGFHYKVNLWNDDEIDALILKVKSEIDFVFQNLQKTLVIFNKFSNLIFNHSNIKENNFDKICKELNAYLEEKRSVNIVLIEIDKILATISIEKSVDFRFYYSSKALYTIDFYKSYTEFIKPIIFSVKGKAKKALIFDCDNTLWKGILGEDGFDNIEMSSKTKEGIFFEEIQSIALNASKQGVLIGLASKNNFEDVEKVLTSHSDMKIRNENIVIKKINWKDKVSNLREIAQELNIGLDSLVFVDDSDFEVELIKEKLPEIKVLKVPSKLYDYPQLLRDSQKLFYTISDSKEDLQRTEMYKQQSQRQNESQKFTSIEDYLSSLSLKVIVKIDDENNSPRIAQLTQKTNQFNLTSKRYTESDIERFISSDSHRVFSFSVNDKFGDYGITGLVILNIDVLNNNAEIDTLLMSCRVIGRNIEITFINFILNYLKDQGIKIVKGNYLRTLKNEQVSDLYTKLGFELKEKSDTQESYELSLPSFEFKKINYIEITHGK